MSCGYLSAFDWTLNIVYQILSAVNCLSYPLDWLSSWLSGPDCFLLFFCWTVFLNFGFIGRTT